MCNLYTHHFQQDTALVAAIIDDLQTDEIVNVEQPKRGTQFKLVVTLRHGGRAMVKPRRAPIDASESPNTFYFSEWERHNAEVVAYHLDRLLGLRRTSPSAGRRIDLVEDVRKRCNSSRLQGTFYRSPAGSVCMTGRCKYYCDVAHGICGDPRQIDVAMIAFLPDRVIGKRHTWRSPWRRSYR